MNRSAACARIGAHAADPGGDRRAFKTLACLERDEPAGPCAYAVYSFLFLVAFALVTLWLLGPSA